MQFVDLHLHSTFSLLDGFGRPAQLVERAKGLGRKAIALTDHGSVSGYVQLRKACKEYGLKPIYGYEAYIVESLEKMYEEKTQEKRHLTIIAKNLTGYQNILRLVSLAYEKGFYYRPTIDKQLLFEHGEGLIVFSGCWEGFVQKFLRDDDICAAQQIAHEFREVFGDDYFLETQHFPLFRATIDGLQHISEYLKIPIVLTCDPHYLTEDQAAIQEVLHAIRDRRDFDRNKIIYGAYQWPADELYHSVSQLFPQVEWAELFQRTADIAERCNVEMPLGSVPRFPLETGQNANDVLFNLCKEGIEKRCLKGMDGDRKRVYSERLKRELGLIREKDFADYFLIVADIVNWAKNNGILVGPARGSSAGSLVCYLIGITEIDPIVHGLIFERFIDATRTDLPDIDVDFEDSRRDEVKKYIYQKYGLEKSCSVATFAHFKGKNSLDEIGKVFQIPPGEINKVKRYLIDRSGADMRAQLTIQDTFEMSPDAKSVMERYSDLKYAIMLEGNLRHMSRHAAGVLIGARPLHDIIAVYSNGFGDRISSVEMKDAADLGLVKIDILGITELSILHAVADMVGMSPSDFYKIPLDDEKTLQGFCELDVEGIFQFEGDGTKSVLRQLPNVDFTALVDCVTLSKPGPAHSGGTTQYIASARNNVAVGGFGWHPILAEITHDTHYQIIYQEQVLRVVKEIGNFSFTDANRIRMAMAKSQGEAIVQSFWGKFEQGALSNGLTHEQAVEVWKQVQTMGRWAFNKSHAVSYAMLAFWSMYMKRHYPLQFYLARLLLEKNEERVFHLLYEIHRRGIEVRPPKLGVSGLNWTIEDGCAFRAGLITVKGIGETVGSRIIASGCKTLEQLRSAKLKGVTSRTIKLLEECEKQVAMDQDYFGLSRYDVLDVIAPNRQPLLEILDWEKQYPIVVAGRFTDFNYKDIFEERRSRGRSVDDIKNPGITKYAVLSLDDGTDRCWIYVDRYLFHKVGYKVWDAYNNGYFVVIDGNKINGWRMIRAKEIKLYHSDGSLVRKEKDAVPSAEVAVIDAEDIFVG